MDPTNDNRLESHGRDLHNATTISDIDEKSPVLKGLGWLDRLLALWILLAMIIGILLGNFVDSVGPALHRGELVGVSIPIGEFTKVRIGEPVWLIVSSQQSAF